MRPSSFIAPLEKNVELSNGAATVITIKAQVQEEDRKKKEVRTPRKHAG